MASSIAEPARRFDIVVRVSAALRSCDEMLRSDPALAGLPARQGVRAAEGRQRLLETVPHDQIAIAASVMLAPGSFGPQIGYARPQF